jgi:hypothetical protein
MSIVPGEALAHRRGELVLPLELRPHLGGSHLLVVEVIVVRVVLIIGA